MSTPYWLKCDTEADVPHEDGIRRLVTRQQHLVLMLPPEVQSLPSDKGRVIDDLAAMLPEYSVFDSGTRDGGLECITIKAVIPRALILAHTEDLVAATRQFRDAAGQLITRLASKLNVPGGAFGNELFRFELTDEQHSGELAENWHYAFHGFECLFQNKVTGQELDVKLGFPGEWGVLDAYFFYRYLKTTPEFHALATLLEDGFHDTARALDILDERELLRRIPGRREGQSGRVA